MKEGTSIFPESETAEGLKKKFFDALENVLFYLESIAISMPSKHRFNMFAIGESSFAWIETAFFDKAHNFHRWLANQLCVFCNDMENIIMKFEIGREHEAIYQFLEFCRRQNLNADIDPEYLVYTATPTVKNVV